MAYNREHGITPQSIVKSIDDILLTTSVADAQEKEENPGESLARALEGMEREELVRMLNQEMKKAAEAMEFERAASIRDKIQDLLAEMVMPVVPEKGGLK